VIASRTARVADSSRMKLDLRTVLSRCLFLAGVLSIASSFAFTAGNVWLASRWYATWDPDLLLRAANSEPSNADYWYRLGLYQEWNPEHRDLAQAISYYRRATDANPRSDRFWMELADAYEAIGQVAPAEEAFERAQFAHPSSSEVAWRHGNFLLRREDYSHAFAEIRRALATDPDLTVQAVSECSRGVSDISRTLSEILPDKTRYYIAALDYFVGQREDAAALIVWDGLKNLKEAPGMMQIVPFVNELIARRQVDEAVRVWHEALEKTGWPQDSANGPSMVFNGGFEHELLSGAFDWQEAPIEGAAFGPETKVIHTGTHALRIAFDGSANLDFQHLWQFVPVEPHRQYHFVGYLRTEEISTDSGVRFSIFDPWHPTAIQILSSSLTGTHDWLPIEEEVRTGADTHLLAVAVRRVPSLKFDNKLSGRVWVDDISLVPVPDSVEKSSR